MKILFLHPYGALGYWNHRLVRQVELMSKRCQLKVLSKHTTYDGGVSQDFLREIRNEINNFKPDIIYANGYLVADVALNLFSNVVYDMGSFMARNALVELWSQHYPDILDKPASDLRDEVLKSRGEVALRKEENVFRKAKMIISWEGDEAKLAKKLYGDNGNIKEISMMFYDLPKPVPFSQKKKRAMTIVSKFGKKGKNMSLYTRVKNSLSHFPLLSVGVGGESWKGSIRHEEAMRELNQSRVYFAPFFCGGVGTMVEALGLGCNVVAYGWHPFLDYVNDELVIPIGNKRDVIGKGVEFVEKAMREYYPPKKKLPTEQEQLDKLFEVFEEIKKM